MQLLSQLGSSGLGQLGAQGGAMGALSGAAAQQGASQLPALGDLMQQGLQQRLGQFNQLGSLFGGMSSSGGGGLDLAGLLRALQPQQPQYRGIQYLPGQPLPPLPSAGGK